jgi:hypothetical protein
VVHGVADQPLRETGAALVGKLVHGEVLQGPRESTLLLKPKLPSRAVKALELELARCKTKGVEISAGEPFSVPVWRDRATSTDVFELYWADLSRPSRSLAGLVAAFFGVLFSLPARSLDALSIAAATHGDHAKPVRATRWLLQCARFFGFSLLPPFAYGALGALLLLVPLALAMSGTERAIVVGGLACVAIAGAFAAVVVLQWWPPPKEASKRWPAPIVAILVFAAILALGAVGTHFAPVVLCGALGFVWAAAGALVFRRSIFGDPMLSFGTCIAFGSTLGLWLTCLPSVLDQPTVHATARALVAPTTRVFLFCVTAVGVLFMLTALSVLVALARSLLLIRPLGRKRNAKNASRFRCAQVVRTALLAHSVPLLILLFIGLPLFSALVAVLVKQDLLPNTTYHLPAYLEPVLVYRPGLGSAAAEHTVPVVVEALVRAGGTRMLPIIVGSFVVSIVLAVLLTLPVLVRSLAYERGRRMPPGIVGWSGDWLDRSMGWIFLGAVFCGLAAVLAVFAGFCCEGAVCAAHLGGWTESLRHGHGFPEQELTAASGEMITAMGVALAGSATLLAFPNRLRSLLSPLWPALDIIGDVDTYLQVDRRAPILARAHTLLRHLRGRPYDQIVVVAHSQGTVIMAEVFRESLRHRRDDAPIRFVTMGSPLVHLYYRFFTTTFDWVERATRAIRKELGLTSWTNLYAYGDYVGSTVRDARLLKLVREQEGNDGATCEVSEREHAADGHNSFWKIGPEPDAVIEVLRSYFGPAPPSQHAIETAQPSAPPP